LDAPEVAIYLPPLIWGSLFNHTEDCVLLVVASDVYDESDYLRDYDEFLALAVTKET
ncbi:MAG: WxcM-like domain-containing protein, partial [Gloeobacteraceae cyanobacterium ES-bin-144]|nr:WxcM-like domain-containing protein [Verrucomicrobiales bacterium]